MRIISHEDSSEKERVKKEFTLGMKKLLGIFWKRFSNGTKGVGKYMLPPYDSKLHILPLRLFLNTRMWTIKLINHRYWWISKLHVQIATAKTQSMMHGHFYPYNISVTCHIVPDSNTHQTHHDMGYTKPNGMSYFSCNL